MSVIYYEGDRICFRPIELADEPSLRRWINDPRVWATLSGRPPFNECREREWIEGLGKDRANYVFGIVVKNGERLIGSCGLHGISAVNHSAELGIAIGDVEFQNQGYGTEAVRLALRFGFEELNLNRVGLHVLATNARAVRAYEKAGFVREGCARQAFYRRGAYRDILLYAVLREQWDDESPAADEAGQLQTQTSQRGMG